MAVNPTRSAKSTVTTFRCSAAASERSVESLSSMGRRAVATTSSPNTGRCPSRARLAASSCAISSIPFPSRRAMLAQDTPYAVSEPAGSTDSSKRRASARRRHPRWDLLARGARQAAARNVTAGSGRGLKSYPLLMDPGLAARLSAIGVDPDDAGDPAEVWRRLFEHFGRRATLVDRYELEAHWRGIEVAQLDPELRSRLAAEVLAVQFPGIEILGPASRTPIEVVPYDEEWPKTFEAWRRRLAAALGPAAIRIEQVGSTAVPGLAAKPIVDIQVIVADIDDESELCPGHRVDGSAASLKRRLAPLFPTAIRSAACRSDPRLRCRWHLGA